MGYEYCFIMMMLCFVLGNQKTMAGEPGSFFSGLASLWCLFGLVQWVVSR